MNDKYSEIMDLDYNLIKDGKRMSIQNRCAQFMPFSALSGYSDAINEVNRETYKKRELDSYEIEVINDKLNTINDNIKNGITCSIKYFIYDKKKNGGLYNDIISKVKRIDIVNRYLILEDNMKIDIDNIVDIDIVKK